MSEVLESLSLVPGEQNVEVFIPACSELSGAQAQSQWGDTRHHVEEALGMSLWTWFKVLQG
jgi:hypothetical protein